MTQAIECARPGAMIGYVGVPHGVEFDGRELFFRKGACWADRRRCAVSCRI